jgi:hypothetical protein
MDELSDFESLECCDTSLFTAGVISVQTEEMRSPLACVDDGEEHWSDTTDNDDVAMRSSESPSTPSCSRRETPDLKRKTLQLVLDKSAECSRCSNSVSEQESPGLSDVGVEDADSIDEVLSDCEALLAPEQGRAIDEPTAGLRVGAVQPNMQEAIFEPHTLFCELASLLHLVSIWGLVGIP